MWHSGIAVEREAECVWDRESERDECEKRERDSASRERVIPFAGVKRRLDQTWFFS